MCRYTTVIVDIYEELMLYHHRYCIAPPLFIELPVCTMKEDGRICVLGAMYVC
jgi:hypothetical protein